MDKEFNCIMELQKLVDKYKTESEKKDLIIKSLKEEIKFKNKIILSYTASILEN